MISCTKPSEWVGIVDTASSSEPEGRGFASRLVFFLFLNTFYTPLAEYCPNLQELIFNAVLLYLNELRLLKKTHKNSRRLAIMLKMSVKRRFDNQSKLIALNVLKMCREKKQNDELFLSLASRWRELLLPMCLLLLVSNSVN